MKKPSKLELSLDYDDHGLLCAERRLLPTGGGGNIIVGFISYKKEMEFRVSRIAAGVHYELPDWKSLKIYETN